MRQYTQEEINQIIKEANDDARDPKRYNTYQYEKSDDFSIYMARRQGRGHAYKKKPCQDYCMHEKIDEVHVFAVADGISACEMADWGAELACRCVVEIVKSYMETVTDEAKLVNFFASVDFREAVGQTWVATIMKMVKKGTPQMEALYQYGTTIMFVVATLHYYICGNLGDGQILLYNNDEGIKLRVHSPKESPSVYSLVNEKNAIENMIVQVYPRHLFQGILLSTDGVYDILSEGNEFYKYTMGLTKRFTDEPLYPFSGEIDGVLMDICGLRTFDDCCIILVKEDQEVHDEIISSIQGDYLPIQRSETTGIYKVTVDHTTTDLVVSKKEELTIPELDAQLVAPISVSEVNDYTYHYYNEMKLPSIYSLHADNKLVEVGEKKVFNPNKPFLELYQSILSMRKVLLENGYDFSEDAQYLMSYDFNTNTLFYKKEAITSKPTRIPVLEYFKGIVGFIETDQDTRPIMSTGFLVQSRNFSLIEGEDSNTFIYMTGYKMNLMNLSRITRWEYNNKKIGYMQMIPLEEDITFKINNHIFKFHRF